MDKIQKIIDMINQIAGEHSVYEVFSDWVHCMAISIQNSSVLQKEHNELYQQREKDYKDIISRYTEEQQERFAEMTAYLVEKMQEGFGDILGEIYMRCEMGSSHTGQFFTPFHISVLNAELVMAGTLENYKSGKLHFHEPAAGAGGMIIAAAQVLTDHNISVRNMEVVAQDLDWQGVYMCYVQLSLYGISAVVVQGDTLQQPYDPKLTEPYRVLKTPAKMGVLV